jgi:beta-phosphoglucomutase
MSSVLHAIVFDYDGVLADTEPLHLRAFQETLAGHDVVLTRESYFEDYLGLDDDGVFRAVAARSGRDWAADAIRRLIEEKARRFCDISASERVLFPGVAERLREWSRRAPIAIASGSLRHEIEQVLDAEGLLDVVPVIVAAGETANGKPAPDPYLRALDLIAAARPSGRGRLDAASCVAVEDSPWGVDSAHAAGMRAIAVTTSYAATRLASADAVVPAFGDLDLVLFERTVCTPARGRR